VLVQQELWVGAGLCAGVSVLGLLGEMRRRRRRSFDTVGFMPWQTVQFLGVLGALMFAFAAFHS
jgi:hypothetical protein